MIAAFDVCQLVHEDVPTPGFGPRLRIAWEQHEGAKQTPGHRHDLVVPLEHGDVTAQSDLGRALYVHYGLDPEDYETNILVEGGVAWFKSEGSIRMAVGLGWPWRIAAVLRILPTAFSDWLYDKVARNRLRIFGKRETCYVPTPDDADRFLS